MGDREQRLSGFSPDVVEPIFELVGKNKSSRRTEGEGREQIVLAASHTTRGRRISAEKGPCNCEKEWSKPGGQEKAPMRNVETPASFQDKAGIEVVGRVKRKGEKKKEKKEKRKKRASFSA